MRDEDLSCQFQGYDWNTPKQPEQEEKEMPLFVKDFYSLSPQDVEGASFLETPETVIFPDDGGTYIWSIDQSYLNQNIYFLPDVVVLSGGGTNAILMETSTPTVGLYQLVYSKDIFGDEHPQLHGLNFQFNDLRDTILENSYNSASFSYFSKVSDVVSQPALDPKWYTPTNQYFMTVTSNSSYSEFKQATAYAGLGLELPNPGRLLIATGDPTGQRSASWGGWVETLTIGTPDDTPDGTPDDTPGGTPDDTPFTTPIPDEAKWVPPAGNDLSSGVIQSPSYEYDESTTEWSIKLPAPFEGQDSEWLAGRGLEALRRGAADALTDTFKEMADSVANRLGLGRVVEFWNTTEKVKEFEDTHTNFITRQLEQLNKGFDAVSKNDSNFDVNAWEQDNKNSVKDWLYALSEQVAPDWAKKLFSSMQILESHSDIFYTMVMGKNETNLADHADIALGGTGNDNFKGGGNTDFLSGFDGDDALFGESGDDWLYGGSGRNTLDGGEGTDTALFAGAMEQYRFGQEGASLIVANASTGSHDSLVSIEQLRFGANGPIALADLLASVKLEPLAAVWRDGVSNHALLDPYVGPVDYLNYQLLGVEGGEAIRTTSGNDFVNLLAGDDACEGMDGQDVLDGGTGSNFLTGGAGSDTFFVDGRGGGVTWSTITDFEPGEWATAWGWKAGLSTLTWEEMGGADGYKGGTAHIDLDANGTIDMSMTFTGKQVGSVVTMPGQVGSEAYLAFRLS
ncbi:calcium-binding protein [Azospirillum isscasi]|uniref:Calcium-binding protein n=1 Tax=Azospirillum isscasi TaxID=3053926 RepID=A0ABU0WJI4_9PROT|nr:calcium-binding protein [Azospirillum isscasi]MDQ2104384.1 calcium-binding protein [Azospirillum isscasi]